MEDAREHNAAAAPWRDHYAHPCTWDMAFPPLSLTDMFLGSAAEFPERPLVDFLGRRFSYRQLAAEARAFAAGLVRLGIRRGDRVGLFLPNVPIYVPAYYGALMAGAVVVNFSPLYTAAELEAQVADSGTRLMVTLDAPALLPKALEVLRNSALERLVVGRLATMLSPLKGLALRVFGRSQLSPMPRNPAVIGWREALGPGEAEPVAVDPLTDIALIQYTGGTTGSPKGAMLSHQNLSANARQIEAVDAHEHERDMMMGALPLFHVFANSAVLNRTVFDGGCIAMVPRFDPKQVLATIRRVRATTMPGVPTMFQALRDCPALRRDHFAGVRACISGGAPLPVPVRVEFEAATGAHLVEGYGLTECAGVVSVNPYEGEDRPGTIGQPLPATRLRLLDKFDPLADPAPGEPGELAINGPQVMLGYWNRPDTDDSTFVIRDGERWLRTGDVAVFDPDGYVRIVDRVKDMIAVGGFKVYPSRVEAVLMEHPAVKEAVVIGVPDARLGERPRAYVSVRLPVTDTELAEWLNTRIGKHERVERVVIRESLPKTMIGKLDRKQLRAELADEGAA
jgi:long-chain acyl-CoA synthetase